MVPVLGRDARRLADAQRCRPGRPAPRLAVVRATATNALDRALDVAAALELRGYGAAGRPRALRRRWSRHDLAFAAAAAALLALGVAGAATGIAGFSAYPRIHVGLGSATFAVACALVACALLPFAERRGLAR
jgi:energy-coupling factor transport system permease protein